MKRLEGAGGSDKPTLTHGIYVEIERGYVLLDSAIETRQLENGGFEGRHLEGRPPWTKKKRRLEQGDLRRSQVNQFPSPGQALIPNRKVDEREPVRRKKTKPLKQKNKCS